MTRPHRPASPVACDSPAARGGLTLYEVVLALGVLLVAVTILAAHVGTGRRAAQQSRLRTDAMLLCRSKLAEVVAGIEVVANVDGAPLDTGDPAGSWQWSLQVAPGPRADLLELRVTVAHVAPHGAVDATATLARLLRDPQALSAAASAAAAAAGDSASESSTGSED